MGSERLVIVGFGGFAREVSWLLREINRNTSSEKFKVLGHVVSDLPSDSLGSAGLLGDFNWLEKNREAWDSLVLGTGTPSVRAKLSNAIESSFAGVNWPSLVHPSVLFDKDSCVIERGILLCANVVGTVNVRLREFSMVNLSCTLGHECEIGACSVLNPGVNISGGVQIGRETLVGTGAQILQNLSVGANSNIGAGAVVTKNVGPGQTMVGIPAKALAVK